jgi:hypothetical protein
VLGVRLDRVIECEVVPPDDCVLPYDVFSPYCTCDVADSFVVYVIVAPVVVMLDTEIEEIDGGVVSEGCVCEPYTGRADSELDITKSSIYIQ